MKLISKTRNIGISAHIDSGKTTFTERILFYTDKIHKIEEVKGGGAGATMDHMELEKEKGITITSAATTVNWPGMMGDGITFAEGDGKEIKINIIDTPGHVDFTVEVERSLRVLDGAILLLCAVAGVQSQSITVDRQMKRYRVPRLAFINKMDRMGANAYRTAESLREKLGHNAVMMQIPIGAEENFVGMVDLITMKALYFEGDNGENIVVKEIPSDLEAAASEYRAILLDVISEFDDQLMEDILEEREITEEQIHRAVKAGVNQLRLTPVFMGSAFKNKGVQPVLDAVARYLPSPASSKGMMLKHSGGQEELKLEVSSEKPLVGMAFKIVDEQFGQLTYFRIYQGRVIKGEQITNTRTKRRVRVGRIVRMHANDRENIESAGAGDIVALVGIDCASGDTFVGNEDYMDYSCEGMFIPIPVIELSIKAKDKDHQAKMSKALSRFVKEDPTFHVFTDEESGETRIAGMGELHLEIYVERIKREYKAEVLVGAPQVNYRETITKEVKYDYLHKKQTGGAGQFAHVVGKVVPFAIDESAGGGNDLSKTFRFLNKIKGGVIPTEYIPSCEKGFKDAMDKGAIAAFPLMGVEVHLEDGRFHDVDSSDLAFRLAARSAMRRAVREAGPMLLEPVMKVEVETPGEYQGFVIGDLSSRRGVIMGTETGAAGESIIVAQVPLSEMFGYSTQLRSGTAGKATYSMEFCKYAACPHEVQEKVRKERQEKLQQDEDA